MGNIRGEEGGFLTPASRLPVVPKSFGPGHAGHTTILREIIEKELGQAVQSDAVLPSDSGVKPVAPAHESGERGCMGLA